jgi:hypothetical protein
VGRLVLLGLVLVLVACGGNEATTVTVTGAPRTETTTLTVTVEPVPTITTSQPALRSRTFQMPSKNIGCATSEGVLVCDVLSGLKPEPKRKCEVDWHGDGAARPGAAALRGRHGLRPVGTPSWSTGLPGAATASHAPPRQTASSASTRRSTASCSLARRGRSFSAQRRGKPETMGALKRRTCRFTETLS